SCSPRVVLNSLIRFCALESVMRKLSASLLVLAIVFSSAIPIFSQSRPRRVGNGNTQSTQLPAETSTQPATQSPTRPPVLGGATRPPGQQPSPNQTPQQTGPEEVDEGDIIKVDTTLVTIPVSVMDRDGGDVARKSTLRN